MVLVRLRPVAPQETTGSAVVVSWEGWQGGMGTVSYTHLRAHETVLDLVCRILLEKNTQELVSTDIQQDSQRDKNTVE